MEDISQYTTKKLVWSNILFFGITTLITLVGLPIYLCFNSLGMVEWSLFLFMASASMMATTLGYHRLIAHRAFKAHPFVLFLVLFFGAGSFQQSAFRWASQHRDHHRFTDTDRDPYDIKKGFWYAHMGWFLFNEHKVDFANIQDLTSNRMMKWQHDGWVVWAIAAGFGLPLLIGLLTGHFWGVFFFSVCARFVVVHQSVFLINSACHMFGTATYNDKETARDSWVCAMLTNGEGYHNYHHAFPNDYRNGIRWFHWDPTKWMVYLLSRVGLVWDVKKTPEVLIHKIRIEQEKKNLISFLHADEHPKLKEALQHIATCHQNLKLSLRQWEAKSLEYRQMMQKVSQERLRGAAQAVHYAREEYYQIRGQWKLLLQRKDPLFSLAS
jgi:stearoyl-CoA desaturase (Delta-9 desaturase)